MSRREKIRTSILYLPRPASKYRGCYPLHFEKRIRDILGTNHYIHLFSGSVTTGYRVDINPDTHPDLVANCEDLPLESDQFGGAFADPPYTEEFARDLYGTAYPKYSAWTREMVRVVRPGGRIGIMQNYIVPRPQGCVFEEIIVILLRIKQYPKVVTVFRKEGL
jgi:hypothetical protein